MIGSILARSRVIPVLTIEDVDDALPLCGALHAGGLGVVEITLRTAAALAAVAVVVRAIPDIAVGVGTLLDGRDFLRAHDFGAAFAVSPGFDPDLVAQADRAGIAYLPGVQTSSEAMAARRSGLRYLKFFPARAAGGIPFLQQLAPVYPELRFCPTGGIGFEDAPAYLAEPTVVSIGGSFAAPASLIRNRDWRAITALAARAAAL